MDYFNGILESSDHLVDAIHLQLGTALSKSTLSRNLHIRSSNSGGRLVMLQGEEMHISYWKKWDWEFQKWIQWDLLSNVRDVRWVCLEWWSGIYASSWGDKSTDLSDVTNAAATRSSLQPIVNWVLIYRRTRLKANEISMSGHSSDCLQHKIQKSTIPCEKTRRNW